MAKEYRWELEGHCVRATLKGNCYVLYLDGDHFMDIHRLPKRQMRYGMEVSVTILGKPCLFVVWEEIPDLVVNGKMLHRGVDYAYAKETRRHNMEVMYTATAVFGLVALAVAWVMLQLGMISDENLRIVSALLAAGIWMVVMGLYYRSKWAGLIRDRNG